MVDGACRATPTPMPSSSTRRGRRSPRSNRAAPTRVPREPIQENRTMSELIASPITTYFRVCEGVRVRYADTGTDSDTVVLMLAPWPESLWAFRRIWARVTSLGRVVALDLPGFGHSDQHRPELIAPDAA